MRSIYLYAILPIIILLSACTGYGPKTDPVLEEKPLAMATPEMALEKALAYTGFGYLDGFVLSDYTVEVSRQTVEDDRTPFLAGYINRRELWNVRLKGVPVGRGNDLVKRDFDILLDPETGRLLRIFSLAEEVGRSDTLPEPAAATVEERLSIQLTEFHQPAEEMPEVNFVQAMSACAVDPAMARIIKVVYIDYSRNKIPYPKTWLIMLRGTQSPMPSARQPDTQTSDIRKYSQWYSVDGADGRLLHSRLAPVNIGDFLRYKSEQRKKQ